MKRKYTHTHTNDTYIHKYVLIYVYMYMYKNTHTHTYILGNVERTRRRNVVNPCLEWGFTQISNVELLGIDRSNHISQSLLTLFRPKHEWDIYVYRCFTFAPFIVPQSLTLYTFS